MMSPGPLRRAQVRTMLGRGGFRIPRGITVEVRGKYFVHSVCNSAWIKGGRGAGKGERGGGSGEG